jgi:hypothetical protein
VLVARWTFSKSGSFIRLRGDSDGVGDRLEVVVSDDLSTINELTFLVQGYEVGVDN